MLEITRRNGYKCNLETIIKNNSQYFSINLKDFEVETEHGWINIFNKYGNLSTLKYRNNTKYSVSTWIFVRNDLFGKILKSYKAINAEFLMLKEKLGLYPYEVIYGEQDFTLISEIQDDFEEIKISEESDEELIEESDEELIEESDEELIETKSPKKMKILKNQMKN